MQEEVCRGRRRNQEPADEEVSARMAEALKAGDAGRFLGILGAEARRRGMGAVAEASGVGRESLYKSLREGGNPRFGTVLRVCRAVGLDLFPAPRSGRAPEAGREGREE